MPKSHKLQKHFWDSIPITYQLLIVLSPLILAFGWLCLSVFQHEYQHFIPYLTHFLKVLSIAGFCTFVLTPLFRWIALKTNVVDRPPKHSPKTVTPMLGGVSIYVSMLLAASYFQPWSIELQNIFLAAGIIVLVGTIDDIIGLSSTIRLMAQLAAALLVVNSGLIVSFMPHTWWGELFAYVISCIWIIGIINATNFIDGADGLASGTTAIASIFFFLLSVQTEEYYISLLAVLLAGTSIAFLFYNFKPAKIYLGDGGSTLMGFLLACIALYGGWSNNGPIIALGIPMLILGVVIFDIIYITLSRIRNGHVTNVREWLDFRAHDHFHHRLINLGFDEEHAVIFIYFIVVILGLAALVLEKASFNYTVILLLLQSIILFIVITMLMLVGRKLVNK